jgi:hypothetical protein
MFLFMLISSFIFFGVLLHIGISLNTMTKETYQLLEKSI